MSSPRYSTATVVGSQKTPGTELKQRIAAAHIPYPASIEQPLLSSLLLITTASRLVPQGERLSASSLPSTYVHLTTLNFRLLARIVPSLLEPRAFHVTAQHWNYLFGTYKAVPDQYRLERRIALFSFDQNNTNHKIPRHTV